MIDLRKEFNQLLEDYGYFILLQRTSRKIRCRCFDELRLEGDSKCRLCMGKGWVSKIERHKTRHDSAFPPTARTSLTAIHPTGPIWTDGKVFYFKHDVDLKSGDMIYEVGWDRRNHQKPTHLIKAYSISDTLEYRADNGRIEYRSGIAIGETFNSKIRNIVIRSLGPVKNYELVF